MRMAVWSTGLLACGALVLSCGWPRGNTTGAGGTGGTGGASSSSVTGGTAGTGGECTLGKRESCYDGPESTAGVGECRAGTRTCDQNGVWGTCEDQTLPGVEDASKTGDENCDTWTGECQWSKRFGDGAKQEVYRLSVAGDGSFFIGGGFAGALNLGDGQGSQYGSGYVAKLGANGIAIWSRTFGISGSSEWLGRTVAATSDGGVILGGTGWGGPWDFGDGVFDPADALAGFVAHFDDAGDLVWSQFLGGAWSDVRSVAVGPDDQIAIGGDCAGSIQIGGDPVACGNGTALVAKLDPLTGAALWIKPFPIFSDADRAEHVVTVALDGNGNVFAVGPMIGVADLGGGTQGELGKRTGFVVKLNGGDGTVAWARSVGPIVGGGRGIDFAVGPDGSPVVGTGVAGDYAFGNGCAPVSDAQPTDLAIVKLDGMNSHCTWSKHYALPGSQEPWAVAVAGDGSVAVAGLIGDAAGSYTDFGFGPHTLLGSVDTYLLKLKADGQPLWCRFFGDAVDYTFPDWVWGVGVDDAGYIYMGGGFDGTVDYGAPEGQLTEAGGTDMYIAKYAP